MSNEKKAIREIKHTDLLILNAITYLSPRHQEPEVQAIMDALSEVRADLEEIVARISEQAR